MREGDTLPPPPGLHARGLLTWLWACVLSWWGTPERTQPGGVHRAPVWAVCPAGPSLPPGPCPPKHLVLLWNVHLAGHDLPRAPAVPRRSQGSHRPPAVPAPPAPVNSEG